jgi:DNA-directed RNA polymerase specialized sigma subunit
MPIDLDRSKHVIVKRITNKVMLRGIEKRRIVDDREDRQSFVKRLGDLPEETETRMPRVRSQIAWRVIKELGMSLAEVARLLGVSTSAISKILHRIAQEGSE